MRRYLYRVGDTTRIATDLRLLSLRWGYRQPHGPTRDPLSSGLAHVTSCPLPGRYRIPCRKPWPPAPPIGLSRLGGRRIAPDSALTANGPCIAGRNHDRYMHELSRAPVLRSSDSLSGPRCAVPGDAIPFWIRSGAADRPAPSNRRRSLSRLRRLRLLPFHSHSDRFREGGAAHAVDRAFIGPGTFRASQPDRYHPYPPPHTPLLGACISPSLPTLVHARDPDHHHWSFHA